MVAITYFNSLPNEKFLHGTKLKALTNDNLNVNKIIFLFDRKGKNAGYSIFSLYHSVFQGRLPLSCIQSGLSGKLLPLRLESLIQLSF